MTNLNGRKITYVKLHGSDAFIPGVGGLGTTLPPQAKTLTLRMHHTDVGVYLNINNGKSEAVIPWANVQLVVYGESVNNLELVSSAEATA